MYAIGSAVALAFLLASPQLFAYEIKQNQLSVSPSVLPVPPTTASPSGGGGGGGGDSPDLNNAIAEFNRQYENVYFIDEDQPASSSSTRTALVRLPPPSTSSLVRRLLNHSLSYTASVCKALGFSVRIDADKSESKLLYARMRRTHSKFFVFNEYFRLATNSYDYCNMLKNSPALYRENQDYDEANNSMLVLLSKRLFFIFVFFFLIKCIQC